jgi:uncharacterized membrane protein YdbT with pleckstrin-like domain
MSGDLAPVVAPQALADVEARVKALTRPHPRLLTQYLITLLLMLPLAPIAFLPYLFRYQTLRYRFDDDGVHASWGILFRREVSLTYARIQDIHLRRGLLERWLGLGSVQIQTASGAGSAELVIEGVTEFVEVRDFLYAKMRGATAKPKSQDAEAIGLLLEIRDDLRAVRSKLDEQRRV